MTAAFAALDHIRWQQEAPVAADAVVEHSTDEPPHGWEASSASTRSRTAVGGQNAVRVGHLDAPNRSRFNAPIDLFALVASDAGFAVDVYPFRALAERALADVLADEPAFKELLAIARLADPHAPPSPN